MLRQLIYNMLEFLSPFSVVMAFVLLFKGWKEMRHLQMLFIYFLLSSVNLGFATYLAISTSPNLIWYNSNGFCSLLFLSLFFRNILHRKKYKKIVVLLSAAGLLAYVLLLIFWDDGKTFFSAGYSIASLLIIIYCFLFLNEAFIEVADVASHTDNTVWIVSGLLTYYLSSYVIQITYKVFTNYFTSSQASVYFDKGTLWGIHNVIYFLACMFIIYNLVKGQTLLSQNRKRPGGDRF